MTNHEVWVVVAWGLFAGTILRGAYRASGINHALPMNVTAASHILLLFLLGAALVDSTGQFSGFWSAFVTGAFAFVVVGALLFMLRRKFEWEETLSAVEARAKASAGLAIQTSVPSDQRAIAEGPHAESETADLSEATGSAP
jgi:hypothetical protein